MGSFFADIFEYFSRRKLLFWVLVIAGTGIFAGGLLRLNFVEDITQILPSDPKLKAINDALQEVRFTDKIMVAVTANDTSAGTQQKITTAADAFASRLETLKSTYISELAYTIDEEQMLYYFDLFYEHLPLYLDSADYRELDGATQPENIKRGIESAYKLLLTPAGSFIQKTLTRDPLSMTPRALRRLQGLQADEGFTATNNRIYTADGKNVLMFITPRYKARESAQNALFAEELARMARETETQYNCRVHIFGAPLVAAGNATRIKKDVNLTMSVVGICLFLFLFYFYRKPQYFLILVLPVLLGGIFGLGVMGWIQPEVSAVSVGVGAILLGITIDYSLHVFTHFNHTPDKSRMLRELSTSLVLSCLTTIAAFFCLWFTRSTVLHDLGSFAGLSILGAALASLLVLPHLLPKKPRKEQKPNLVERALGYPFHKNIFLTLGVTIISIAAIVFFRQPEFESDMDNLNYMSEEMQATEQYLDSIGDVSLRSVFVIARGKDVNEALEKLAAVQDRFDGLKREGVAQKVVSPSLLLLPASEQRRKIQEWEAFWTPARKASVKQSVLQESRRLGFRETAFSSFYALLDKTFTPQPPEVFSGFTEGGVLSEFINKTEKGASAFAIIRVKSEDRPQVYQAFEGQDQVVVFDKKYLTQEMVKSVSADFQLLANLSLVVVFLILLLAFGRIEMALITFTPLILSWVWVMGAMQLFGLKMNIINLIVTSFVFGLGIDYSIFIINGLIQDYRTGTNRLRSYKSSIFLSAFTTILGMGGMIFAGHPALRSIAIMSVVGIASVLLLTYTLLPVLFHFVVTARTQKGRPPLTLKNIFTSILAWSMVLWGFHVFIFYAVPVRLLFFVPLDTRKRMIHWMLYAWANVYLFILFFGRRHIINRQKENFHKQAVIIANHQSFLDTVLMFSLTPNAIIATNNRIYNNPIFGPVSRFCDFLNVSDGFDVLEKQIRTLWGKGYSFLVFPEGTRSEDRRVHRFHKGAFKLAEDLQADIVPVLIHGLGDFLPKGAFWGVRCDLVVEILPRIGPGNTEHGTTYTERSKSIRKYMVSELERMRRNYGMTYYLRKRIHLNYVYLSPVLEWYLRVKSKMEKRYALLDENLPLNGKIYDVGCGYGFASTILHYAAEGREITGLDHDEEKIATAQHRFMNNGHLHFYTADIRSWQPDACDGIVISDVLHYINTEEQVQLLQRCMHALNPGGVILLKDGDSSSPRFKNTQNTEVASTRVIRFNKKVHERLYFFNEAFLKEVCGAAGFRVEEIGDSKFTANKTWKIYRDV